jgi:hypothetical protein
MSLATSGMKITLWEKALVPGDFVHYNVFEELDAWRGNPAKKAPPPIPVEVKQGMQFSDPHKETVDKISQALKSLMGETIENKQLVNRRDWR